MTFSILNLSRRAIVMLAGCFIVSVFFRCSSREDNSTRYEQFQVIRPLPMDTVYKNEYVADIQSIKNVEIRARVQGFVEAVHVDEGKYVKQGQLLFTISSQEYRQDLLKAKASLSSAIAEAKSAEVNLNNVKTLVGKSIVSKSELDLAEAELEALTAKIEEARAQEASASLKLSFAQIRAPFDGVINRIPNKVGSLITEGTLLTTLSDNSEVYAYFNVSEKEYLDFTFDDESKRKNEILLTLANGKLHSSKGEIETIESEVHKSTGNIAFRAKFSNADLVLKHGSTGKVQLVREIKKALLIPQKSTFEVQDIIYVYSVSDSNVVHRKAIDPKVRIDNFYVLESDELSSVKIVFEGIQRLKEGDAIEPAVITMDEVKQKLSSL